MAEDYTAWPIAVIEDRYGGAYSKGQWLAIAKADLPIDEGPESRVAWCLENGPHDGDIEAQGFWLAPPNWIAAGDTPDNAIAKLKND